MECEYFDNTNTEVRDLVMDYVDLDGTPIKHYWSTYFDFDFGYITSSQRANRKNFGKIEEVRTVLLAKYVNETVKIVLICGSKNNKSSLDTLELMRLLEDKCKKEKKTYIEMYHPENSEKMNYLFCNMGFQKKRCFDWRLFRKIILL